jgi:hypothetical protein
MKFNLGEKVAVVSKNRKNVLRFGVVEFINEYVVRLEDGSAFSPAGANLLGKREQIVLVEGHIDPPISADRSTSNTTAPEFLRSFQPDPTLRSDVA